MPDSTVSSCVTGQWQYDGFPTNVRIDGRVFHKLSWMGVSYDGVMARYYEAGRACSRIAVLDDGTYRSEDAQPIPVPVKSLAAPPARGWGRIALGVAGVLVSVGLLVLLRPRGEG